MSSNNRLSWGPPAAYLYVLKLDPVSWAWEYLRRNPHYRSDFHCSEMMQQQRSPYEWGLANWENPHEDARSVEPHWQISAGSGLTLGPACAGHTVPAFDFWSIPGHKILADEGDQLRLTTRRGSEVLGRVSFAGSLKQGDPVAIAVSAGRGFTARARAAQTWFQCLDPGVAQSVRRGAVRPSRSAVLHMQMLQALDGAAAGASHREIAHALFGATTDATWGADSRWRAQVRSLLKRGHALSAHGYRRLLGAGAESARSGAGGRLTVSPSERTVAGGNSRRTQRGPLAGNASPVGTLA